MPRARCVDTLQFLSTSPSQCQAPALPRQPPPMKMTRAQSETPLKQFDITSPSLRANSADLPGLHESHSAAAAVGQLAVQRTCGAPTADRNPNSDSDIVDLRSTDEPAAASAATAAAEAAAEAAFRIRRPVAPSSLCTNPCTLSSGVEPPAPQHPQRRHDMSTQGEQVRDDMSDVIPSTQHSGRWC